MNFKTQKQRQEFVKEIIKRNTVTDAENKILKHYYLEYYSTSNGEPKCLENEICEFVVRRRNPETPEEFYWKPTNCIHIIATCYPNPKSLNCAFLCGKKRSWSNELYKAFRKVVEAQTMFRRQQGYEVDHVYPFSQLLTDFYAQYGYTGEYLQKLKVTNKKIVNDDQIVSRFWKFHEDHAKYQLLSPRENRQKSNKLVLNQKTAQIVGKPDYKKALDPIVRTYTPKFF